MFEKELISIVKDDRNEKIEILFLTAKIIRLENDIPLIWKLDLAYLDALCVWMHIANHEELCTKKFLDGGIDSTSHHPFCVGKERIWDLIKYS